MGEDKRVDNKVELLGHYGSDETIACSAWTSTSRNLTDEKKAEWRTYRQALRDIISNIPTDLDDPENVVWPTEPS